MNRLWRGLLVCGFLLVFAGCGQPISGPTNTNTIELELWTLQLSSFEEVIQPILDEFEAQHTDPKVTVRWVDVPFSQGEKRTLTAMLSHHVPDVVNLNPDFAALLAARGTLMDMGQALSPSGQGVYVPAAWQACTLQQHQQAITVGLPWYLTSSVQLANQQVLKKLGLNQPPQTLGQLTSLANKEANGYVTFPYIAQSGGFLKSLYQHGIYQAGEQLTDVLAKPETRDFLQTWVDLYQQGHLPAEMVTDGPQAAVDRYQSGGLAFFNIGANFLNIIQENAPSVYQKTAVYPQFPAGSKHPLFSTMLLAVPQQSQHPKLAIALAQHLTNTTSQLALANAAPVLPSTVAGLQQVRQWHIPNEPLLTSQARQQSAQQLLAATGAYPAIPHQKTIHQRADYYTQAALLGTLTVDDALNAMAKAIHPTQ